MEGVEVKRWLVWILWSGMALHARAGTDWFTVVGDPKDPNANTVQIDPEAAVMQGARKNMYMRVSRSTRRLNWESLAYRSYEARVAFDCREKKAEYMIATFYPDPLWRGLPAITTDYADQPKPMELRDFDPNPTERIIRAACRGVGGDVRP
ncbi:surface-adhesin E family protein [Variovorax humicola]|uniref:Surface-adhesin E family protein n=1 Tax=Variovorax humicola TaxID=1769758 RepID=A0ABU8W9W3_9BURK